MKISKHEKDEDQAQSVLTMRKAFSHWDLFLRTVAFLIETAVKDEKRGRYIHARNGYSKIVKKHKEEL